jgi:uncharacterized membrane protein
MASVQVTLPDRPTAAVPMDKPVEFYVAVVPHDMKLPPHPSDRAWTKQEIAHLNVGYVRLELVPRGEGKLLVRAPQLYFAIRADGTVRMSVDVVNEGTRRLDNVEVKTDPPPDWTKIVAPEVVPALGIGEERRVELSFTPPKDIAVGKYEIRLRTSALSDDRPVSAEDKTAAVEIQAGANVIGTAVLVLLIVGVVGGIVFFGIKISKR